MYIFFILNRKCIPNNSIPTGQGIYVDFLMQLYVDFSMQFFVDFLLQLYSRTTHFRKSAFLTTNQMNTGESEKIVRLIAAPMVNMSSFRSITRRNSCPPDPAAGLAPSDQDLVVQYRLQWL